MATVDQIIQNALDNATRNQQLTEAATNIAVNMANVPLPGAVEAPIEIDEFLPDRIGHNSVRFSDLPKPSLDLDDIIFKYDAYANTDELAKNVVIDFDAYLDKWFPNCLPVMESACAKLKDWIENGGTGIDPAVLQQIWDEQRSREVALGKQERDAAAAAEARRGWTFPQGAMQSRLWQADQAIIDRLATLGRQIAIDEATREQENVRFAIQTVVTATFQAHNAAANFVEAVIRGKLLGLQNVQELANAAARLYEQSINYFNARLRAEDLNREYEQLDYRIDATVLEAKIREKSIDVEAQAAMVRNKVEAAIQAMRTFGSTAASALSSTNSMVTQIVNESE